MHPRDVPPPPRPRPAASEVRGRRGSVLIVVLVTLVFATTALLLFIERASTDLLVHVRDADRIRLRQEAYSALETTLAVLVDFREVLGGLHSPAEGWGDPLEWVGYEPAEGHEVRVEFVDESGRLPLPRATYQQLYDIFESWGVRETEAELWADALMGWMKADHTPVSFDAPRPEDYERAEIGFLAPARPLRSFRELRAIDHIREAFFDEDGNPNERGRRFAEAVSLFNYAQPNLNAAPPGVLSALARYDDNQLDLLGDFRSGDGIYRGRGPGYFTSANEVATVLGEQAVAEGFGTAIQALRITVTVKQGNAEYQLSVVVAPPGGARLVAADAIPRKEREDTTAAAGGSTGEPESTAGEAEAEPRGPAAARWVAAEADDAEAVDLEYPFTLLEIRERNGPAVAASPSPVADF